jgi:hypothetical protein
MSRLAPRSLLVGLLACVPLVGAANAQATTVTLGSDLTNPTFNSVQFGGARDLVQTALAGRTTVAPFDGTLINWKVMGASGGPLSLRVVRQTGAQFIGAGSSSPATPTGLGVQSFNTHLRILTGELIGLQSSANTDTISLTPTSPAPTSYFFFTTPLVDGGAPQTPSGSQTREIAFQATLVSDCTVPDVKFQKLAPAQAAITAAGCANGTVTRPAKKKARKKAKFVVAQSPAAGNKVDGLTPVNLTLGKKPKKKK